MANGQWPLFYCCWCSPIEINICELTNSQTVHIYYNCSKYVVTWKNFCILSCPTNFYLQDTEVFVSWRLPVEQLDKLSRIVWFPCMISLICILEWIHYRDPNYFHYLPPLFFIRTNCTKWLLHISIISFSKKELQTYNKQFLWTSFHRVFWRMVRTFKEIFWYSEKF